MCHQKETGFIIIVNPSHASILSVLHCRFLTHWHDRFDEKSKDLKKKDKDHTVNKVPCLLTRWLLPFNLPVCLTCLPYTGPIDLRVTLSLLITSTVVNSRENAAIQD
ncbi:uncharacterized protein LOC124318371 [Daphnia pulicaria]|uniref:uncharacterized protein LOC124318371 n=1 Tax=Daphnia pulicaria TaxID=35523 RepID=UPI001EEB4524|nr:uncharacterized protein LOC124318371 [Daphnia pulicaria]